MPRIRTVKPEFWSHGQVVECSPNARLLFIGLWNFCDDAGRHPVRLKQIKAEVFPADEFTPDEVRRMVDELAANDLITLYVHEDREFLQVNGWKHQKIDKPQDPRYPGPFDDGSTNDRRSVAPEGKGREGKGEYSPNGECASPDGEAPADATPYQKIVDLYHACCPSLPRVVKLTPGRRQAIRARWKNELPSLDDWEHYFAVVEQSDFLTGRTRPTGGREKPYVADLDFLTKQGYCVKVMEGKYD